MGFFNKIKEGLKKTKSNFINKINSAIKIFSKIDEELFEELEELLITSDVGALASQRICDDLRKIVKKESIKDPNSVKQALKDILIEILEGDCNLNIEPPPSVILVIGVNGVGKTTTIGKLAAKLKNDGKNVILGAADTFRAAAIDQLEIWAERSGVDIVKHQQGSDPAAVVFDTICAAKSRDKDIVICDTAGRLHNKTNLMNELGKIERVIKRELPNASKEVLLVLDATTGQNAINQAKGFLSFAEVTGIILTKLDGTAKGAVVLAIKEELGIPVKFIGLGEQIDDLQPFSAKQFVDAIFEE
ncbi:MAG: signal recognition particle-docking protein FtsY [Oscillospiraceae bacterium]|jgi:fused signal recognition particle receptor|nr:signal recognition particle-docking protein FtsY [Oscillospiraceae bacterium]